MQEQASKPEPVFFTMYFDKDFHPDDYYLQRKEEYVFAVLKQKIEEVGGKEEDYEEPVLMDVAGKTCFTTIVNCGNMWKEIVKVVRAARFPKGYEGPRGIEMPSEMGHLN